MKIDIIGGQPLEGNVRIFGAKNSFLILMASLLVTKSNVIFKNIPIIADTWEKMKFLEAIGYNVERLYERELKFTPGNINPIIKCESRVRTSVMLLGVLTARCGHSIIPKPTGDQIGTRSIDMHVEAMEKMGIRIKDVGNYIEAFCDKLVGTEYMFKKISVGATQNILLTAILAEGTTTLYNCAVEPEIVSLCHLLLKFGANISGIGTSRLVIVGNGGVLDDVGTVVFKIIPDRLQAISFLLMALITNGKISVTGDFIQQSVAYAIPFLNALGGVVESESGKVTTYLRDTKLMNYVNLITGPYPSFATDFQALFFPVVCLRSKKGRIQETLFDNRFKYLENAAKMNFKFELKDNVLETRFSKIEPSTSLLAHDIRSGMSSVLAALAVKGKSTVHNFYHIERGYDNLVQNISNLGGNIFFRDEK